MQFEITQIIFAMLGFAVGIIGSGIGLGGGLLITPALLALGLPMNIAIGTSISQTVGAGIISTIRHGKFGNVDVKLGLVMLVGAVLGVETGAQAIQTFKIFGRVDLVVSISYISIAGILSFYVLNEALRNKGTSTNDSVFVRGFAGEFRNIRVRPMINLSNHGINSVSLWIVLLMGYLIGLIGGFLGVAGGFLGVPLLIYFIGVPTPIAIGTQLFMIMFSSSYGALTHALKGNINFLIAFIMLIGILFGAWIGPIATKAFRPSIIRLLFGSALGLATLSMIFRFIGKILSLWTFTIISQATIFGMLVSLSCIILVGVFRERKPKKI